MASGDVIEVVPGQVYRGATNFSEFALTGGLIGSLPPGITSLGVAIPSNMDGFGILEDPAEGQYFAGLQNASGNIFGAMGIDSFLNTPNQQIFEVVTRNRRPSTLTSNHGFWGPCFQAQPAGGAQYFVQGFVDKSPGLTVDIEGGGAGTGFIAGNSVIDIPLGEWFWCRYRFARASIGAGATNIRIKIWQGTLADEPAAWLIQSLGLNIGPLGDGAIGIAAYGIGETNRVYATSFLSFTTGASEADLDLYPPLTPSQIAGGWEPPDPVVTVWEECGAGAGVEVVQDSTGLVFRDQFDRADAQALGNGWTDWESAAGQVTLVSQEVLAAATSSKTGGYRPTDEVAGNVVTLAQINCRPDGGQLCGVKMRWNGTNQGYHFRLDARSAGSWNIVKNDSSVLASSTTAPRPQPNQWRGIRGVIDGTALRHYATGVLADGQDLSQDLALIESANDGSIITANNRTGFEKDVLSVSANYDEFFVCLGYTITVTGLPTGYKAQIDARAAVAETAGVVTFDVQTWALPATTVNILDASDNVIGSLSPAAGVWAGDVYSVSGVVSETVWEPCDG